MPKHSLILTLSIVAASFSSLFAQAVEIADARNTNYDKVFKLGDKFVFVGPKNVVSWDKNTQSSDIKTLLNTNTGITHRGKAFAHNSKVYFWQNGNNNNHELWETDGNLPSARKIITLQRNAWILYDNGHAFLVRDSISVNIFEFDLANGSVSHLGTTANLGHPEQVECRDNLWLFSQTFDKSLNQYIGLSAYSVQSRGLEYLGASLFVADNYTDLQNDSLFYLKADTMFLYSNGVKERLATNIPLAMSSRENKRTTNFIVKDGRAFVIYSSYVIEVYKPWSFWTVRGVLSGISVPLVERFDAKTTHNAPIWFSNDTLFVYGFENTATSSVIKPIVWFSILGSGRAQKFTDLQMPTAPGYAKNFWLGKTYSSYFFVNGMCSFFSESPTGFDLFRINLRTSSLERLTTPDNRNSPFDKKQDVHTYVAGPGTISHHLKIYSTMRSYYDGNGIWVNDGTGNGFQKFHGNPTGAGSNHQYNIFYIDDNSMITIEFKTENYYQYTPPYNPIYKFISLNSPVRTQSNPSPQLKAGEWITYFRSDRMWGSQPMKKARNGNILTSYFGNQTSFGLFSLPMDNIAWHIPLSAEIDRVITLRNSNGNLLWYKTMKIPWSSTSWGGLEDYDNFVLDKDGSVYLYEQSSQGKITEMMDSISNTNSFSRLIKISESGEILWSKSLQYTPDRIFLNEDGNIETLVNLLMAECHSSDNGNLLWKLDGDNDLTLKRTFWSFAESGPDYGAGTIYESNGSKFGYFSSLKNNLKTGKSISLGGEIKTRKHPQGGIGVLVSLPTEKYASLGLTIIGERIQNKKQVIIHLDKSANPVYGIEIPNNFENYGFNHELHSSFDFDDEGNLVIAYFDTDNNSDYREGYEALPFQSSVRKIVIRKFENGHLSAQRILFARAENIDIVATQDGGFVLTGKAPTLDSFKISSNVLLQHFTAKLFFDQHFPLPPTVKDEAIAQDDLTILPVPTDNYLYVRSDDDDLQDVTFECFDVQGRQVMLPQGNFMYKEWSVDVSSIPSGMYFLRVKSGKDSHALKFIKN